MKNIISCWNISEMGYTIPECCSMCHTDHEDENVDLCEKYPTDEVELHVCCRVSSVITDEIALEIANRRIDGQKDIS